ncbi:MAG: acetylornithine deacetylase, partial [Ilumatobacteraceae bacterium]|nr:acetylornithine deacetylase [Ilumatobacteraceae bacterium]
EISTLVRIPSVSGTAAENDAQIHVARMLREGGLEIDLWPIDLAETFAKPAFPGVEVHRDEAWGLVGRLVGSGDGPTLMLNGHVDVVPIGDPEAWSFPAFDGEIRNGNLHGRGSCDMKAGLIAAHWAVQAIRSAGIRLRGDLLLAAVQGEEDGGLGTFALLERGWRADACLIPEPTDLDIVPANSGSLTFRLRVHGHATHASRRTEGVSAIEKFWPIWHALTELETCRHAHVDPMAARWKLAHPLSIGTVHAGDWASSVPDLLIAEGRLGVALDEPVEHAREEFEAAVARTCEADPWLRDHPVEVEWWGGQFASGRLHAESDLVERMQRAHAIASESRPNDVWAAPYGSDLRLLVGQGGIPTLQYGPGDVARAHGPDELVPVDDIVITARALALMALDICGVAG